jgi:cholesterol oxidase
MRESRPGITFRETMSGPFALGEQEPRAGERAGKVAGTTLTMHAAVEIRDLSRFIADPTHPGSITGRIDFAPLGIGISAPFGLFNLFSPTGNPRRKLMMYELGFDVSGKSYYVAGHKEVQDDPGFDLWRDTTTLYTRLHEGRDASGPILGSGVLRLGPADLMRLIATVHATNVHSIVEQARTVAQFGRFFLGELWEMYAKVTATPTGTS